MSNILLVYLMTACMHHQAVFSRIFNRHRFENNELEWLFRRYILRVSRSSSSSSSLSSPSTWCLSACLLSRCSMPRSDKQSPSLSFSLLPLPPSALSRWHKYIYQNIYQYRYKYKYKYQYINISLPPSFVSFTKVTHILTTTQYIYTSLTQCLETLTPVSPCFSKMQEKTLTYISIRCKLQPWATSTTASTVLSSSSSSSSSAHEGAHQQHHFPHWSISCSRQN